MKPTVALSFALALCAGCGPRGPQTFHVSGEITYKGVPLPAGEIIFDPDVTKGGDGPQGFVRIVDGKFDTALPPGRPVVAGPMELRILGFDGKPGPELPLGRPLFQGERLVRLTLDPAAPKLTLVVPEK